MEIYARGPFNAYGWRNGFDSRYMEGLRMVPSLAAGAGAGVPLFSRQTEDRFADRVIA
jgi:hypothetical protein